MIWCLFWCSFRRTYRMCVQYFSNRSIYHIWVRNEFNGETNKSQRQQKSKWNDVQVIHTSSKVVHMYSSDQIMRLMLSFHRFPVNCLKINKATIQANHLKNFDEKSPRPNQFYVQHQVLFYSSTVVLVCWIDFVMQTPSLVWCDPLLQDINFDTYYRHILKIFLILIFTDV